MQLLVHCHANVDFTSVLQVHIILRWIGYYFVLVDEYQLDTILSPDGEWMCYIYIVYIIVSFCHEQRKNNHF